MSDDWRREPCALCGASFHRKKRAQRFCYDCQARDARARSREGVTGSPPRKCPTCGKIYRARKQYCSGACWPKAESGYRIRKDHRVRRGLRNEAIDPLYIFERDGWRCHLCGKKIDKEKTGRHPMAAVWDHLVPLSKGGEHIASNLRAAHYACNAMKKDGARDEQLLLVG